MNLLKNIRNSNLILVKLRTVIILIQMAFVISAHQLLMLDHMQFSLSGILIAIIFIINVFFIKFERVRPSNEAQVFFDFLCVSILLYICGGFHNPLIVILLINFFIAPVFLRREKLIYFLPFAMACILLIHSSTFTLIYENVGFIRIFEISLLTLFLVVFFTSYWIYQQLESLEVKNSKLTNFTTRIDRYRALGLLAAGVCHELGTPLNTLQLDIDRIKEDGQKDDSDITSMERNIGKCIESLRKLNQQVHDQDGSFFEDSFQVSAVINSFVHETNFDTSLSLEFRDNLVKDAEVNLPKILFLRSLLDLVENAKQANAKTITLTLESLFKDQIEVTIQDDGVGFDDNYFQMFGMPFATSKKNGTGLGLYHLQNLLALTGGELSISNNKGACIKMIIPIHTGGI
jgi:two-component system sensor histidine kinase RegB